MDRLPNDIGDMDRSYAGMLLVDKILVDKINEIIDWINKTDEFLFNSALIRIKEKAKELEKKRKDCIIIWDNRKDSIVFLNIKTGEIVE